mmetsp:Transcript_5944/g.24337  ORF Transcript_5944/g.24337 Transcript_5944/m.24337 type:complete len:324 (-) Transcript_5944:351-1322(-)
MASLVRHLRLRVDLQAAHGVVHHGHDDGDVPHVVVHVHGKVVEELLAVRALLGLRDAVVLGKRLGELGGVDANLLGHLGAAAESLHDAAAAVVLAVPLDLLASLAVENQAKRALVLVHLAADVVAAAELVAEALAVGVEKQSPYSPQRLSGEELHLGVGLARVDDARGVYLHGGHVNRAGADGHRHLDAVARAVLAVGRGKPLQLGPEPREERVLLVVRAETAGGDDHRTQRPVKGAILRVLDADDAAGLVGEEPLRLRLGHDLGQVAVGVLHDLLERLHERVGDGESGEALLAAVRALVGVAAELREEREVEAELLDEPING